MSDFALQIAPSAIVSDRLLPTSSQLRASQVACARANQRPPSCSSAPAGYANRDLAQDLDISERTVSKWRGRFVARRLDGLHDLPRPGLPRSVTEDQVDS